MQKHLSFDPQKMLDEAEQLHPDIRYYMAKVIEEKKYPELAYKSCRGILSLASKVGRERLINACRWAAGYGMYNYMAVADILKNKQDEQPYEEWNYVPKACQKL